MSETSLRQATADAYGTAGDLWITVRRVERQLAQLRDRLGAALAAHDTGAVTELPDHPDGPERRDDPPYDPRD